MTDTWITADEDDDPVETADFGVVPYPEDTGPSEVDDLRALLAVAKTPARRKMLADRIRRLGG